MQGSQQQSRRAMRRQARRSSALVRIGVAMVAIGLIVAGLLMWWGQSSSGEMPSHATPSAPPTTAPSTVPTPQSTASSTPEALPEEPWNFTGGTLVGPGINTSIMELSDDIIRDNDGVMAPPGYEGPAGWVSRYYHAGYDSSLSGTNRVRAIIVGHVCRKHVCAFDNLLSLQEGDTVTFTPGSGSPVTYRVAETGITVAQSAIGDAKRIFDYDAMISGLPSDPQSLVLIGCNQDGPKDANGYPTENYAVVLKVVAG